MLVTDIEGHTFEVLAVQEKTNRLILIGDGYDITIRGPALERVKAELGKAESLGALTYDMATGDMTFPKPKAVKAKKQEPEDGTQGEVVGTDNG